MQNALIAAVAAVVCALIGYFYKGKQLKKVQDTVKEIADLVDAYRVANRDGKITKDEMRKFLDELGDVIDIWMY